MVKDIYEPCAECGHPYIHHIINPEIRIFFGLIKLRPVIEHLCTSTTDIMCKNCGERVFTRCSCLGFIEKKEEKG